MKVLLDHNIPVQMAAFLHGHQAHSARAMGWDTLQNGDLLKAAEQAGFDVLLTADQSIVYQQNSQLRQIALVVTSTNHYPTLERNIESIQSSVARAQPGSFEWVSLALGR